MVSSFAYCYAKLIPVDGIKLQQVGYKLGNLRVIYVDDR